MGRSSALSKLSILFLILIGHFSFASEGTPISDQPTTNVVNGKHLRIRMYLEGALLNSPNTLSSQGRRMMRDHLRLSPFDNNRYIPNYDPYQGFIGTVDLSKNNGHIGLGASPEFGEVADPDVVFAVTGENAIVDWVFVEIRSAQNNRTVLATRSGLLQRDGDVVDVDGISELYFPDLTANSFHVVIKHRNHIGAMSQEVNGNDVIDFTNHQTPVFDFGDAMGVRINYAGMAMKMTQYGVRALWAGNFNNDHNIKFETPNDDHNIMFTEYLKNGTAHFANIGYFQGDFDMDSRLKYEAPNDDCALLQNQILNYNLNYSRLINFNYMSEQVPARN